MTALDLVIRGGTIVDGTGAPAFPADVGIRDGRIVAMGDDVGQGDDELDASGRLVVPGFIDIHTHYDAQVLWDPSLSPSSDQGVTTVVMGNCGFSIAPVRESGRDLLLRTLEKVEDMRLPTLRAGIEWDFETYGDYLDAIARRQPSINVGGYVGHTAVRVYTMGEDATEREATVEELAAMRELVADALTEGALGFSTDRAGFIIGAHGKPIPSVAASQSEVEALMRVTAEVDRGIVHIAPGDDYRWLYDFQRALGRPVNWSSILAYPPGATTRTDYRTKLADHAAGRANGADIWAQVTCRPIQQLVSMLEPAPLSIVPAFGEIFAAPVERRHELYADPSWRERAQRDLAESSIPLRWGAYVVAETLRHSDLIGQSIASIAADRECRPLDVMCDLALEDELQTRFRDHLRERRPPCDRGARRRGRLCPRPLRRRRARGSDLRRGATRGLPRPLGARPASHDDRARRPQGVGRVGGSPRPGAGSPRGGLASRRQCHRLPGARARAGAAGPRHARGGRTPRCHVAHRHRSHGRERRGDPT